MCLSPDDFNTFYFGTVAGQRDAEQLSRGKFKIKFEIEDTATPQITSFVRYVMLESPVYFEVVFFTLNANSEMKCYFLQAYRPNLKVLQEFGKDNFPLERYIVHVNRDISPPSYLPKDAVYEISNGLSAIIPAANTHSVKILDFQQWPSREQLQLDESQYEAFRAALTKQIVIIQGPPGAFNNTQCPLSPIIDSVIFIP